MKNLTLILTLLFSTVMFSSPSNSDWKKLSVIPHFGHTVYINPKMTKKNGDKIYYLILLDYNKPVDGLLSVKVLHEGECNPLRFKIRTVSGYKKQMGEGKSETTTYSEAEWDYPTDKSTDELVLRAMCEFYN